MKKCCFIIPYFGKLPNYFQLFLNSCKYNTDFNWLIFTDTRDDYQYPQNVQMIQMSFEKMKEMANRKLGEKVALLRPYKLCDLRPMYGVIFEEYIKDFKCWGYCDVDTIMGNLSLFITDEMLNQYDKLFALGHMTIYKNTATNNRVFMCLHNGREVYKDIIQSESNNWFDEEWKDDNNINQIFLQQGKHVYENDLSLNIDNLHNKFMQVKYVGKSKAPKTRGYVIDAKKDFLCTWECGHLIKYHKSGKKIIKEEYPYIHLQGRKMRLDKHIENCLAYKIIPDEFLPLEFEKVSSENYCKIKKNGKCFHVQRMWIRKISRRWKKILNLWK